MTGQWSADQSTWPAHLRDDAPSQQCGRCGRYTRSPREFFAECRMPQPDGYPCGGRFESPGILLDIYTARRGAPIPTAVDTPLAEAYQWAGKGHVRQIEQEPDSFVDALTITRALTSTPHLLIRWQERRPGWHYPTWGDPVLHTIVGHGETPDGLVRMVAPCAGRMEDELHLGRPATKVDLHKQAEGTSLIWYWRTPEHEAGS